MRLSTKGLAVLALLGLSSCASLSGLGIQAPQFSVANDQGAEIRLLGPSLQRPVGGAAIRIYARVANPNPVGITLSRLAGTLQLEGFDAADADFPLGLPLEAGASTVVPLDIAISFASLPGLAEVIGRAAGGRALEYSMNGTATVDAGLLGQPTFGPMRLFGGQVELRR